MINERLFGQPLDGAVAKKLTDRQKVAGQVAPGESIDAVFPDKDGKNQADLSSRTPFVRMWTSMKFISPEITAEVFEEIENPYFNYQESPDDTIKNKGIKLSNEMSNSTIKDVASKYTNSVVEVIRDKNNIIIKWIIKENENVNREKLDYSRNTYIVGDYNYQKEYGESGPNDSIVYNNNNQNNIISGSLTVKQASQEMFPNQLEDNPLFKPQAGITSVRSETEGSLGVIKVTVVNFTVNNFYDFDRIYNRFFLKPGATVFVDFGWSSVKELYKPESLFETGVNYKNFLYDENTGFIAKNKGDVDVIKGLVTNYTSKINQNGTVDCSVTLKSANSSLLSFSNDKFDINKVKEFLTKGVRALATLVSTSDDDGSGTDADNLDSFLDTPNVNSSTSDVDTYLELINILSIKSNIADKSLIPYGSPVQTGIYVNSVDFQDTYISWGFLEDQILNAQFGFGKDVVDINTGKTGQVRFDSSYSFITRNDIFFNKQKTLSTTSEGAPAFLYPWHYGNTNKDYQVAEEGFESYTVQQGKYPISSYPEESNWPSGLIVGSQAEFDNKKNRIPLREIFVNTQIIIEAFETNDTITKVIKNILKSINEESYGILNLQMTQGESESELRVVDNNRPEIQSLINSSGISTTSGKPDEFENMFMFEIMSKNSIVSNYDLSLDLPQGNIGNMYAILSMGNENKIFPITDLVDNAAAISSLDPDSLSILYEPDNGGYRSNQINDKTNDNSKYYDVFGDVKNLISTDTYSVNTEKWSPKESEDSLKMEIEEIQYQNEDRENQETDEEQIKRFSMNNMQVNIDKMTILGYRVVSTIRDYFDILAVQEIKLKEKPNLLPFQLSLTTYGISTIVPGDTFRVDYLPKIYKNNAYLQTTKVINEINTSNWTTTLETVFRPLPSIKESHYTDINLSKVRLSPKVILNEFQLDSFRAKASNAFGGFDQIDTDISNMTNIQIQDVSAYNHITFCFSFHWTGESKEIKFPVSTLDGELSSEGYNQYSIGYGIYFMYGDNSVSEHEQSVLMNNVDHYFFVLNGDHWAIIKNFENLDTYEFNLDIPDMRYYEVNNLQEATYNTGHYISDYTHNKEPLN